MMSLLLVLSPNLKTSSMKTSRLLDVVGACFDTLLLNLPVEIEEELIRLVSGSMSIDEFVEEARRRHLIPEPIGMWEYSIRPILEALPRLDDKYPDLSVRCYSSSEHEFASVDVAVKMANLTLRTALRGEVEVEEWRESLLQSLGVNREAREAEMETIMQRIGKSSVCVSDMGGRVLGKSIRDLGIFVKIRYVESPYHFTPLMILERLMARRSLMDDEIERLVRFHLDYIKSYVYKFDNRDRAHYEWVYDMVPWLREKIDKGEIEILDRIILRY